MAYLYECLHNGSKVAEVPFQHPARHNRINLGGFNKDSLVSFPELLHHLQYTSREGWSVRLGVYCTFNFLTSHSYAPLSFNCRVQSRRRRIYSACSMVDPFSLATGIAGLLSLTIEIVSISYAYGSGVKGAPKAISSIVQELLALKNILSDLQNNVILNPDIAEAFEAQSSSVLERLGGVSAQHGSVSSHSQIAIQSTQAQSPNLLDQCKSDLQDLLEKVKKKADHGTMRTAISNLAWPLSESENQKKIDMLHRYQSMFQASVNIDTLALVAKTHQTVIGIRDEKEDLKKKQAILEWLSPLSFAEKQRDANSRRHPETGQWLLDSAEFRNWEAAPSKKERLEKLLDVTFDNLPQPISSSPPSHACTRLEDLYPVLWCDHCRKALDISKTNYYRKLEILPGLVHVLFAMNADIERIRLLRL